MVSERVFENLLIFEVSVLDLVIFYIYWRLLVFWRYGINILFKLLLMEIHAVHHCSSDFFIRSSVHLRSGDCLIQKLVDFNRLFWPIWIHSCFILIWPNPLADSLFMIHSLSIDPSFFGFNIASESPIASSFSVQFDSPLPVKINKSMIDRCYRL